MATEFMLGLIQSASEFSDITAEMLLPIERGLIRGKEDLKQAYGLWLSRFFRTDDSKTDNIEESRQLTSENCEIFFSNAKVGREKNLTARFNMIRIEPIMDLAKEYQKVNLESEAAYIMVVYDFALKMRRLYREFFKI